MNWGWLVFVVGVLCWGSASAQQVLRGTVVDSETGEPLPSATVQILGIYDGTIANAQGAYELVIRSLPARVQASCIGYKFDVVTLTDTTMAIAHFKLEPAPIEMAELVVTANDQGPGIMQKVIAQKKIWRKRLTGFEVDAYSRFVFKNHTGIVSIVESASDAVWHSEKGWREVIKARRQTSNMDFDFDDAVPAASAVTNLYDDEVHIAGHRLMGVTHPQALDHYDFHLIGRRYFNDQIIYDIAVKPKNRLVSGFEGQVSVLDGVYAMIDAELKPGQSFLFPPPIKGFTVSYRQQFRHFGDDFYLPVDFQFRADLNIGLIGLTFPPIKVEQTSRLSNYRVNVVLPDSLFESKKQLRVDSVAVKSDSLLTQVGGIVPLSVDEQEAYARIDSTMTLDKAYKPTGFLARFIDSDEERKEARKSKNKSGQTNKQSRNRLFSLGVKPEVWFGRVDGAHLGMQVKRGSKRDRFGIDAAGAYNVSLERWAFHGASTLRWGSNKQGFVTLSGFRGTDMRYTSHLYSRTKVSSQQIFGSHDYFDYFWNEGVHTRLGYRVKKQRLTLLGGVNVERHESVGKTTDWHLWGSTKIQRVNPAIAEGNLRSVMAKAVLEGELEGPSPIFGQQRLTVDIEHSRPGLMHSDFSFTKYQMVLDWRFKTMFRRRFLPNVLDIRVVAQTRSGKLPLQKYGILDTWLDGFSTFGAFRSKVDYPYEGEKVFGVFWEHNFRTIPFELLGWRWAAEQGIGLIVHGGHGRTWISDVSGLTHALQYQDRFHHEMGLSVNGLFNLFRVDVTRRLDRSGLYVSVGLARIF